MRRGGVVLVLLGLFVGHGCTCGLPAVACGDLGEPCCSGECSAGTCGADNLCAALDASVPAEDAGQDADAALGCGCTVACCDLCSLVGYLPAEMGQVVSMPNACTSVQIQDFVTACVLSSTSTMVACQTFFAVDAGACDSCLATSLVTDSKWTWAYCETSNGPCWFNTGGCTDIAIGDTSKETAAGGAGSCGDAVSALDGCEELYCSSCVKAADFAACVADTTASGSACTSYEAAVQSTTGPCAILDGDAAPAAAASCFVQMQTANQASLVSFINVFCGTGP